MQTCLMFKNQPMKNAIINRLKKKRKTLCELKANYSEKYYFQHRFLIFKKKIRYIIKKLEKEQGGFLNIINIFVDKYHIIICVGSCPMHCNVLQLGAPLCPICDGQSIYKNLQISLGNKVILI